MRATNLEIHGLDTPLDEELHLKAGEITCIFEPARGYLRRIQSNGKDILQLVYLHVRAEDWSTIMPTVTMVEKTIGKDHFHLVWDAHSVGPNINFKWRGTATGNPDGTITYRCEGEAVEKMITNRTGVCALIPADFMNSDIVLTHPDGSQSTVKLPEHVSPVEPLANFVQTSYPGATLILEGDHFNAEDQRNWTDNSYKVYPICGTRSLYTLQAGAKVMNQVTLKPHPKEEVPLSRPVELMHSSPLPSIGVKITGQEADLSITKGFANFLHLELPQDPTEAEAALAKAQAATKANGQDLVLEYRGQHRSETVREAVKTAARVIGFDTHGGPLGEQERQKLSDKTITGASFFADLNFHGKIEGKPFGAIFGVMPQTHTFDETSILDNARTVDESTRSVRVLAEGAPVHAMLSIANSHDPRLSSLFGAVWLLTCLEGFAAGGLETVAINSVSELWPNGAPGPAAYLLAKLLELQKEEVQPQSGADLQPNSWHGTELIILNLPNHVFLANRTRGEQPILKNYVGKPIETLTLKGWVPRDSKDPLGPYETICIRLGKA